MKRAVKEILLAKCAGYINILDYNGVDLHGVVMIVRLAHGISVLY